METTHRLALGHPVLLLAASPVVLVLVVATALLLGAGPWTTLAAALLVPWLLASLGGTALVVASHRRSRAVSPARSPLPEAWGDGHPADLRRREVELRRKEAALVQAAAQDPPPPYADLVELSARLRQARVEHAEVLLALGLVHEQGLADEAHLQRRAPEAREAQTTDEAAHRTPGPP